VIHLQDVAAACHRGGEFAQQLRFDGRQIVGLQDPLIHAADEGDQIALIGGMDERVLETNDLAAVEAELLSKLPAAMVGSGYVLQVDHSVSPLVNYETYKYFVERGLEIGTYRDS
jgi:uroporphyrinogen-III decarboxylase